MENLRKFYFFSFIALMYSINYFLLAQPPLLSNVFVSQSPVGQSQLSHCNLSGVALSSLPVQNWLTYSYIYT